MKKINLNLSLKVVIICAFIISIILIGFIIKIGISNKSGFKLNTYNDNGIKFSYDNTFKLNNKKDYIELTTNDNGGVIAIKKMDYSYVLDLEVAESISYQITLEDGTYNKIYEEEKDNKYYFLYENYDKEKQIEVIEFVKDDYLYLIVFEANSDEFDLYQESFNIIINTFKV